MNQRLVESRKARAAAPETGSRASLSRRSLALVSVLLGTPLPRMTSKPPRKVGAPPVVDAPAKGSLGSGPDTCLSRSYRLDQARVIVLDVSDQRTHRPT